MGGVIDPNKINPHDLCYQFSKHGPDYLFRKLRIKDVNDKPHFAENNIISNKIQMSMFFKTND